MCPQLGPFQNFLRQLGALGRQDRASLKAKLKELGYKSLRVRVKLEEELMGLPPPARV